MMAFSAHDNKMFHLQITHNISAKVRKQKTVPCLCFRNIWSWSEKKKKRHDKNKKPLWQASLLPKFYTNVRRVLLVEQQLALVLLYRFKYTKHVYCYCEISMIFCVLYLQYSCCTFMQLNCNYCNRAITEKTECCLTETESFYAMLVFYFILK